MADDPATPRRFQFSLRTLLLAVTLLGIACAFVVPAVRAWQERLSDAELDAELSKAIADYRRRDEVLHQILHERPATFSHDSPAFP